MNRILYTDSTTLVTVVAVVKAEMADTVAAAVRLGTDKKILVDTLANFLRAGEVERAAYEYFLYHNGVD